jgi:hypothetical protein
MKSLGKPVCLAAFALLVTSCGFWNPDPADKLGNLIEREARNLKKSSGSTASFTFLPDPQRVKKSPRFTGSVTLRVVPDESIKATEGSVAVVSEWFWTSYHSRFVRVSKELKATKEPGETFTILLEKSGDFIQWTGLE